jgi:hypothetical protein
MKAEIARIIFVKKRHLISEHSEGMVACMRD